jgi:hypothetical protein
MPGLNQLSLFESSPPQTILVIELWPATTNCVICDAECLHRQGLAIWEDRIVPDEYQGEWGGAPACPECFEIARDLQAESPGSWIPFSAVRRRKDKIHRSIEVTTIQRRTT